MISSAQLSRLSDDVLERFSRTLSATLIADHPGWLAGEALADKERRIADMLRYGQKLGLTRNEDLGAFADAVLRFGTSLPLPQHLLAELRLPGLSRAAQLENLRLRLMSGRDAKTRISL